MNTIQILVKLPISLTGLSHFLDRCNSPERIVRMLHDNPIEAEELVRRLAKDYFYSLNADILISSLKFSYVEYSNVPQTIAYFSAVLIGTPTEIAKAVGPEKLMHGKIIIR